jgi:flagellar M-ring protein FliF
VLADAATPQPLSSSRRVTRNYELDRTISHTRVAPGSIRRLSVAVVVNDRIVDDTPTPLTEQELERVNALVREAVGFDAERGDSVNVSNVSFQTVEAERIAPAPGVPFWKEPFLWDALKHLFGALGVLFLIFFVLRPVLKTLAERGKEPAPSEAAFPPGMMQGALPGGQMPPAMAAQGGAAALAGPGMGMPGSYEDQVGAARKMVNDDPKRVAQVVKTWVGGDE